MRDHLFNPDKIKYVMGDKPDVECILCAISDRHPDVESLEIIRTENFIVSLNLYPYNPGHIMVFPCRHITGLDEFSDEEALEFHSLQVRSIEILKEEFNPGGFNLGCNIGKYSGASILHIHQHIVPRYDNETGFLEVLSGTRVFVNDPHEVHRKLKERFKKYY